MAEPNYSVSPTDFVQAGTLTGFGFATEYFYDVNVVASTIIAITGAIVGIHAVWVLIKKYRR